MLKVFRTITLSLLFAVLANALPPEANAVAREFDRLVLNDGEVVRVCLGASPENALEITEGRAERVPTETTRRSEFEMDVVELDVLTRNFSVVTGAWQLFVSGAKQLSVTGIDAPSWGSLERPALFIDRDCAVTLNGRAVHRAFIEVHPLAVVTIDAGRLASQEIVIIGNPRTRVLCSSAVKVTYSVRETKPEVRTSGYSGSWSVTAPPTAAPSGRRPGRGSGTSPEPSADSNSTTP